MAGYKSEKLAFEAGKPVAKPSEVEWPDPVVEATLGLIDAHLSADPKAMAPYAHKDAEEDLKFLKDYRKKNSG